MPVRLKATSLYVLAFLSFKFYYCRAFQASKHAKSYRQRRKALEELVDGCFAVATEEVAAMRALLEHDELEVVLGVPAV